MAAKVFFIVKGQDVSTDEIKLKRDIECDLLETSNNNNTTSFTTGVENYAEVQKWFNEEPEIVVGFGYPRMTCIFFNAMQNQ